MRLNNKVSVITGGGSGIGRSSALVFAREGSKVVVADYDGKGGRETVGMIRRHGGDAIFVRADVSKSREAARMVGEAVERFGRVDVLFNSAGVSSGLSVQDTSEEEWDRMIDVNLKGVFLASKHAIPHMKDGGGGSIVNMASVSGLMGSQNLAAYCASKGGVVMLTRAMACDLGRYGIRANCICPSHILTPMVQRFLDTIPRSKKEEVASRYPLGRFGRPEEVANVALFLASDESSFVTGSALVVDGGSTAQTASITEYAGLAEQPAPRRGASHP